MKVWVVMSNDYPDSVWETEEAAEAYCKRRNEDDIKLKMNTYNPRVYYRAYEFTTQR